MLTRLEIIYMIGSLVSSIASLFSLGITLFDRVRNQPIGSNITRKRWLTFLITVLGLASLMLVSITVVWMYSKNHPFCNYYPFVTISGKVEDTIHNPISNVNVQSNTFKNIKTLTDANGEFKIKIDTTCDLSSKDQLIFSKEHYKSNGQIIPLYRDTDLIIKMRPK